jgi:hypothetical protein
MLFMAVLPEVLGGNVPANSFADHTRHAVESTPEQRHALGIAFLSGFALSTVQLSALGGVRLR